MDYLTKTDILVPLLFVDDNFFRFVVLMSFIILSEFYVSKYQNITTNDQISRLESFGFIFNNTYTNQSYFRFLNVLYIKMQKENR